MIIFHLLIPLLYSLFFWPIFRDPVLLTEFTIGVYIGFLIFFLDRFLHVFFLEPEAELSKIVRELWRNKQVTKVVKAVVIGRNLQERLITRSVFFLIAYVATAIFILTSTGSVLGMGVVLGIGLHYCFDLIRYSRNAELFRKHFFWQLKKGLADREILAVVTAFCIFFIILSLLVLR